MRKPVLQLTVLKHNFGETKSVEEGGGMASTPCPIIMIIVMHKYTQHRDMCAAMWYRIN